MKPLELRNRWLLVTGASSGLGREMAKVLARDHGANLVVVARRQERLVLLASELEKAHEASSNVPGVDAALIAAEVRIRRAAASARGAGLVYRSPSPRDGAT